MWHTVDSHGYVTWLSFISAFPTVLAPSLSRTQLCVFSINFFASQIKSTTWIPAYLTLCNTPCSNFLMGCIYPVQVL